MIGRPPALLGAALLSVLGCRPTAGPVAPADGPTAAGGGVRVDGGMTALAPVTRAAELLPPDTLALIDLAGPARLAEIVGRDALVKQFPAEHLELVREMSKGIGADLLDPKELARLGVDINGRIGIAVVGAQPLEIGFYWSLSDPGRFRQFAVDVLRRNKQEVVTVPMAGAEVIRVEGQRVGLVIRGSLAMFVVQEGGESKRDLAVQIATADPNMALSNDRKFRKATGALAPADWTTYVDAGAIWERVASDRGEQEKAQTDWARDALAEGKASGANAERIAELERQVADNDQNEARWKRRREASDALAEKIIGGTGRAVWTVSAKPGGLVGEGQLEVGADSVLMKVARNHPGTPALPKALSGRPLLLLTGATDTAEMMGLLDLFLQSEGESWTEITAEVKKELGVDLEAELRPLVTGTAGVALTLDGKLTGDTAKNAKQLGLAIDLELADAAKATEILDRVATRVMAELRKRKGKGDREFVLRRDPKQGAWAIDVAKWRTLYVSIAGHHLVISSDAGLAKRLATGTAGTTATSSPSAALAAASLPGAAFGGLVDVELGSLFGFGLRKKFAGVATEQDPEAAKVPPSKAYKAKLRELQRAEAEVSRLEDLENAAEIAAWTAAVAPWGAFAGNVTEQVPGMLVRGGLFVRAKGGFAGALFSSLVAVKALSDRRPAEALSNAFENVQKRGGELAEIRSRDVAAWRARHPGTKGSSAIVPAVPVD